MQFQRLKQFLSSCKWCLTRRRAQSYNSSDPNIIMNQLTLITVSSNGEKILKRKQCVAVIDSSYLQFLWTVDNVKNATGWKSVDMQTIKEVRYGLPKQDESSSQATLLFTVIYGNQFKNVTFECTDRQQLDIWVGKLSPPRFPWPEIRETIITNDLWLRRVWRQFDRDGDGTLDRTEVNGLLSYLNIQFEKGSMSKIYEKLKIQKNQPLDYIQFKKLIELFSERQDLRDIFVKYSNGELMDLQQLQRFLQEEQQEDPFEAWTILKDFSTNALNFNFDAFREFMISSRNDIHVPGSDKAPHDMSHPITDYFIASSHNTYLLGDQLTGESSVEAYIRALQSGCRCVELDCWDGPHGEPIIYHGHTLTSRILFSDVVKSVKKHAFVSNPFPVVFSIENHCSLEQQDRMASLLTEILGDELLVVPLSEEEVMPSPEALKRKFIIKGKRLPTQPKTEEMLDDEDDNDEEDPKPVEHAQKQPPKKVKVSQALSDLVIYFRSFHFKSFETHREGGWGMIASLSENKARRLAKSDPDNMAEFNTRLLTRVYPAGLRVNSSNYDPIPLWHVGCQLVALNYQTDDKPMRLYHEKFQENARSGYLLKPFHLRRGRKTTATGTTPFQLEIEIISAHHLPKPNRATRGEVIDPFVIVELFDNANDGAPFTTKVCSDNGFNPIWREKTVFHITSPDVAMIYIGIWDKDLNQNDFIAYAVLRIHHMQQGYRHIQLRYKGGDLLPMANMFVHVRKLPI